MPVRGSTATGCTSSPTRPVRGPMAQSFSSNRCWPCVEKAMQGVRDIDDRNSWPTPSSTMRGGPSVAAIAVAYDDPSSTLGGLVCPFYFRVATTRVDSRRVKLKT